MSVDRIKRYRNNLYRDPLLRNMTEEVWPDTAEAPETEQAVVYGVLAPMLNSYVLWVLENALDKGIKRLYFLARDGWMAYLAAKRYSEAYYLNIDCRYLYCSRYSVRVPSYYRDVDKALDYITLGGLDVTPAKLYARAGFTGERKQRFLDLRILDYDPEEQIPRRELKQIKEILRNNSLFVKELEMLSREAEPAFHSYLKQEGLLEPICMAFVDSGWVGSMQRDLNEVLSQMGRQSVIEGYYFGLYEVPVRKELHLYHPWFFSPEDHLKRKVRFNNCLFEALFTAPHGMTLKYEYRNDQFRPVLDEIESHRITALKEADSMFRNWQETLMNSREVLAVDDLLKKMVNPVTEKIIEKNLALFMHHPTREEAERYGSMEFTDDILEYGENRIAARLTERELRENHFTGRMACELLYKKHVKQSGWYEGSAVLYGHNSGYHIWAYSIYKRMMYVRKKRIWRKKG